MCSSMPGNGRRLPCTPRWRARHQPSSLQRGLHPGVAQIDLVFPLQLLVKMADVQIEVFLSIEPEYGFYRRQGNALGRGLASPAIKQAVIAKLLVTFPDSPHMPIRKA